MTIGILIPCHNEEKSIRQNIEAALGQTRRPDQIVVVDDASTDKSVEIIKSFGDKVTLVELPKNTGNKSYVQEEGLKYISTDIFVATDADSLLHPRFLEEIERDFQHSDTVAVCGYVKSVRYNWLTACREMEYVLSQNLYKQAQAFMRFVYVIPGCAGAFRTQVFKECISFDHDTLTEDLDFTYKLHEMGFKIRFNWHAWVYTQDPVTISSYVNQMRRWYGGGWQNLRKHWRIIDSPGRGMEMAFMYVDSFVAAALFFLLPLIDVVFFGKYLMAYVVMSLLVGAYSAIKDRRIELFLYSPSYVVVMAINAWVFLEQFVKEVLLRRKNMVWFQPERINIKY